MQSGLHNPLRCSALAKVLRHAVASQPTQPFEIPALVKVLRCTAPGLHCSSLYRCPEVHLIPASTGTVRGRPSEM